MMRHNIAVLLVLFMLTVSSFAVVGCGESNPDAAPEKQVLIETLQRVPLSYEDVTLWNLGAMRSDPDLKEVYEEWKDWSHVGYLEEAYGIKIENIDYLGDAGLLQIARGDFDTDTIRDQLPLDYHRDSSYTEMEVWMTVPSQDPLGNTGGVILDEGLFVRGGNIGDVKAYIDLAEGRHFSMYDRNAAEVVAKLPNGIMTRIWRDRLFEGLIVAGQCFEKDGDYLSKMTQVYKFMSAEDAVNAGEYFDRMKKDIDRFGSVTITRDGEFVELCLTSEGNHLMSQLFPR